MRLFLGSFAKIDNFKAIKDDFKDIVFAKWVEPKNIHLTYLFLGDVKNPKDIILKLKDISYRKKGLNVRSLGFFGYPPKILFAKIKDKEIEKLHKDICKRLDIQQEENFIPHITLARIKRVKNRVEFLKKIDNYKGRKFGILELELCLIKSILTPNGPKYSILEKF